MASGLSATIPRVVNSWRHPVTGLEAVVLPLLFVTHATVGIYLRNFVPNLSLACSFLFLAVPGQTFAACFRAVKTD